MPTKTFMIGLRNYSITTSGQWRYRQSMDPYVRMKSKFNYRARSAFKLFEINEKFKIIKPGHTVLDLGAAPGGWTQVALQTVMKKKSGKVIAVDLLEIDPIENAHIIKGDIHDPDVIQQIQSVTGMQNERSIDVLLSDMAHSFTGFRTADVPKVTALVEMAVAVAGLPTMLKPGGTFVAKFLMGEGNNELFDLMRSQFKSVVSFKPR
ncbi:ribosomal RNA methyltransferase FtsJ domain-containing protein [Globomyces pollinis-pini]|nr:ribosomal RNA methyltransferase FtsJ domain-containing protein [Globomyces pollinis-pini]